MRASGKHVFVNSADFHSKLTADVQIFFPFGYKIKSQKNILYAASSEQNAKKVLLKYGVFM